MGLSKASGAESSLDEQLHASLLDDGHLQPVSFVKRWARWHGPNPVTVLLLLIFLTCVATIGDWRVQSFKAAAAAADDDTIGGVEDGVAKLEHSLPYLPNPALMALTIATGVMAAALILEFALQKVVRSAISKAMHNMHLDSLSLEADLQSVRTWACLGQVEVRNTIIYYYPSEGCGRGFRLRSIRTDIDVWKLVSSLGRNVHVNKFIATGADSVLVHNRAANLQGVSCLQSKQTVLPPCDGTNICIQKVMVSDISKTRSVSSEDLKVAMAALPQANLDMQDSAQCVESTIKTLLRAVAESVLVNL